ncbi:hypothetical protein B0H12DRAFT_984626, partial [Mycena haematopus]
RLLSDPNLNMCPDYTSEDFADIRSSLDSADDAAAVQTLVKSWTKNNDKLKAQWAQQVAADKARAIAEERVRTAEAEEAAAVAAERAEEERLEAEKKKPKLGNFDANGNAPAFIEARISPFAQRKLEKMEYCLLWPFTPVISPALSSNDDISSVRLTQNDDNGLSVQAGPSSNTHKGMVRDDQLTWREFDLGKSQYLKEITRAGWPKTHVEALSQFFYLICNHSLREQPMGDATLKVYADRTRFEWHQTLGSENSFNIARINESLLAKIGEEL